MSLQAAAVAVEAIHGGVELSPDVTDFDMLAWKCKGRGKMAVLQIMEQAYERDKHGLAPSQVVAAWGKELLRAQHDLWAAFCAVPKRDREAVLRRWGDVRAELRGIRRSTYPAVMRLASDLLDHDDLLRDEAVVAWVVRNAGFWVLVDETLGVEFNRLVAVLSAKMVAEMQSTPALKINDVTIH